MVGEGERRHVGVWGGKHWLRNQGRVKGEASLGDA